MDTAKSAPELMPDTVTDVPSNPRAGKDGMERSWVEDEGAWAADTPLNITIATLTHVCVDNIVALHAHTILHVRGWVRVGNGGSARGRTGEYVRGLEARRNV